MTIIKVFIFSLLSFLLVAKGKSEKDKLIARQGQVSFLSYTSVENIKAENNQVLSVIDLNKGTIAVSILMNAFVFEKALMREHFNESYIETDIYPKATFEGAILNFDPKQKERQTKIIKGIFSLHGVSKEIEIKANIEKVKEGLIVSGTFATEVAFYNIKIPKLLAGNIAKTISAKFRFIYEPYEN